MGIRNGAAGIIVLLKSAGISILQRHTDKMDLDVTRHHATERADKLIYLPGCGTADGIGNAYPVHTRGVDSLVEGQDINEIGPERILGRETNFASLAVSIENEHGNSCQWVT